MNLGREFHAFGLEHLIVIALTVALPFVLAGFVRRTRWPKAERAVAFAILVSLIVNYICYMVFVRYLQDLTWQQMLPMQMCDWAMVVIMAALWTGNRRWFEVAYFWGIGGTLQAVITPNLRYAFPDLRFISFFVAHCGIIVGVIFLMLTRRLRPHPISIARVFAWSEVYFVIAIAVDLITGVNYGFLLHKPEAFSLLSLLSDSWPIYLLEMHLLALIFFLVLYVPFAFYDLLHRLNREGVTL